MNGRRTVPSLILAASLTLVCWPALAGDWEEGRTAFDAGDYELAARHFAEVTKSNPSWPGGFYMLGRSQHALGREADAVATLRRARELDPSNANVVIVLGQSLLADGQSKAAVDLFDGVASADLPPALQSLAANLHATALLQEGDSDRAIAVLRARIVDDDENPSLDRTLARALAASGDREGAFASFSRAYELDPDDTVGEAAVSIGLALASSANDSGQQLDWYERTLDIASALAKDSPSAEHDLLAGDAALGAGEFTVAETWCRAAVAKNDDDPETHYCLGRALSGLDKDDQAYDAFAAALKLDGDPDLANRIHGRMGRIAACRLDLSEAASHYRAAHLDDRAATIDGIMTQSAAALSERADALDKVREFDAMARELEDLGDADGVKAMREQAAVQQRRIAEIEKNLEEVRAALCQ